MENTDNTFNSHLRRIRKEKKITQEQLADAVGVSPQAVSKWEITSFPDAQLLPAIAECLGVSIDELFGKKKEEISIYDRVLQHLHSVPQSELLKEGFAICRTIPMASCGGKEYTPLPEAILNGADWDNHSEVTVPEGFAQSRNNGNLQYFLLMPEPEGGYDDILAYDEQMVELFAFLATPNVLRTMYFLAGQNRTMFFNAKTLANELQLDTESATGIIAQLLKFKLIWEATLTNGKDCEKIYRCDVGCNFISFLTFTRTLLQLPHGFSYQKNSCEEAYFKHNTYEASNTKEP